MSEAVTLETGSEEETHALGVRLAQALRGGERIGLSGELGAGKTCLVRGIAEGLGIKPDQVRSPSFTLLALYEGGRLPLYHIDLFRLRPGYLDRLALREYLYGHGVAAIEWFERLGEPIEDFLEISMTFVGAKTRRLVAAGHGVGYGPMLTALRTAKAPGAARRTPR
jgi:tRNA threonylcarbamoyladenosine biosynthesis protein TsaE